MLAILLLKKAKILNSFVVAKGSVVEVKNPNAHRVVLNVAVDPARRICSSSAFALIHP
jgi:hypothetical protein